MIDNIEDLRKKHYEETEEFINNCPHTDVLVEDHSEGFRKRSITIRCKRCRLNLAGYVIDGSQSYMSYVRPCINGHPDSREKCENQGHCANTEGCMDV